MPKAAKASCYSPENAAILRHIDISAGRQTLVWPPFKIDLALLTTLDGASDIDHDGLANDLDPDDDNDGVPDLADAFPLDPKNSRDTDGDGIGDHANTDSYSDGWSDAEEKQAGTDPLSRLSFSRRVNAEELARARRCRRRS